MNPADATGVKDVYITFEGGTGLVVLNWFRFRPVDALPGLPAVGYDYEMLKNRRSDVASYPMYMPRLNKITTELGGEVSFIYGQSHPCPPSLGSYVRIPYDCFPDWVGGSPDLWNKWKVLNMSKFDTFSGNSTEIVTYTYSTPTWGYNDDIYNSSGYFWNEYRGSERVSVIDASGAKSEYRFYRGMEGDYQSSFHASITLSDDSTRTDYNWLRGQVAEVRRLRANNDALSRTVNWYEWELTNGSGRKGAYWTGLDASEFTLFGSVDKTTRIEYDYDNYGNITLERLKGDTSTPNDDRLVERAYVQKNGGYMVRLQSEKLWAGTMAGSAGNELAMTEYAYDGGAVGAQPTAGNLTLVRSYSSRSTPNVYRDMTTEYDSLGRPTMITDASNHSTTTAYHATYGYVQNITNALGHTASIVADPGTGAPLTITDANGNEVTYEYDEYGRVKNIWLPTEPQSGNASYTFDYHPEARPAYIKSSQLQDAGTGAYIHTWAYVDGFGRELQTQRASTTANQRIVSSLYYNDRGQLQHSSSPYEIGGSPGDGYSAAAWTSLAHYHYFGYDDLGNQWLAETKSYTNVVYANVTIYDAWQQRHYDPNGHKTAYDFDAFGNLIQVQEWNHNGVITETYTTTYTYDLAGNLTGVIDDANNISSMSYDLLGSKIAMTDPDMGSWIYQYDAVGNLTGQRDGNNQWLYMAYDELNRLSTKRKDDPTTGELLADYTYDATGQKGLLSKTRAYSAAGTTEVRYVAYDARNRLTHQEWVIPGTSGGTFRLDYTYNAADQQTSLRYPGGNDGQQGEVVSTSYNAIGQITGVSGSGVQYLSAALYNARGQTTELRLDTGANGLTRQYAYETNTLRLHELRAGQASPYTDLQGLIYSYDNNGNILSITDTTNSGQVQSFQYDWLHRLISASTTAVGIGQYSHSYAYDSIGNITSYAGSSYTYGSKPHAVTAAFGNSYDYDGAGNMTGRTIDGVMYTLSYDAENRMTGVSGGTVQATFVYDVDGKRVKGTVNGVTTVYIAGVYEYQEGATTAYYPGPGGTLALRRAGYASDNGVEYLLGDHLGSTSVLANQDGTLNASNSYYPYGGNRGGAHSTLTAKRFTGQYHEAGLPGSEGLYYYNARWYDPQLARFVQADSIVPDPAAPQALNRYMYTLGNPLRYTDPTGHRVVQNNTGGLGCETGASLHNCIYPVGYPLAGRRIGTTQADVERANAGMRATGGVVLDVIPGVGDIKGLAEVFTGYDLVSGESLGLWRLLGLVGASELRHLRHADGVVGVVGRLGRGVDQEATERAIKVIRPPTNRNALRSAMEKAGMTAPADMVKPQVHHNLPWEFKDWFAGEGRALNVNEVQFGRWVEGSPAGTHQNWTRAYNNAWRTWISQDPNATRGQVLQFLEVLLASGQFP